MRNVTWARPVSMASHHYSRHVTAEERMLHHLPPPTERKARTVAIWLNVIMISPSGTSRPGDFPAPSATCTCTRGQAAVRLPPSLAELGAHEYNYRLYQSISPSQPRPFANSCLMHSAIGRVQCCNLLNLRSYVCLQLTAFIN